MPRRMTLIPWGETPRRGNPHRTFTYPVTVSKAVSSLLVLGVVLFFVGWSLVFASGHGGNSSGGSEAVWRVGGLMLYASVPTLLIAGLLRVVGLMRPRRRGSPTPH